MNTRRPRYGPRRSLPPLGRGGTTLIEMMVYVVVAGILMAGVYKLLIGQSRAYAKQRELMDVHETIRGAAALLAWEIRQASAAGGDIYDIGANSITLRSIQGSGIVCVRHATLPRFGLLGEAADMAATPDDSALVLAVNGTAPFDDTWHVLRITTVATPAALGVGTCAYASGGTPDIGVEVAVSAPNDTAGVLVGAPFTAFRRTEYGLYEADGRWWLGRKVGGAVTYDKMTGPLRSQAAGGLVFTYADSTGAATADPTKVATVDFVIRVESHVRAHGMVDYQIDSVATKVAVRG